MCVWDVIARYMIRNDTMAAYSILGTGAGPSLHTRSWLSHGTWAVVIVASTSCYWGKAVVIDLGEGKDGERRRQWPRFAGDKRSKFAGDATYPRSTPTRHRFVGGLLVRLRQRRQRDKRRLGGHYSTVQVVCPVLGAAPRCGHHAGHHYIPVPPTHPGPGKVR